MADTGFVIRDRTEEPPPPGFRWERGMLWPADDVGAAKAAVSVGPDLETVYRYCRGFNVVVQAGGCCGVWPEALSRKFRYVYTFEPDAVNFQCLTANVPDPRVTKINAALGFKRGPTVGLVLRPDNVGAHYVGGDGDIPVMCIDDLGDGAGLNVCDLIYLDIEGYEFFALMGAEQTIARCRPTIVVEEKGLGSRYGIQPGRVETKLLGDGYRVAERVGRDVIFVPS